MQDVMVRFRSKVNYDGPVPTRYPDAGPCHLWTAGCFDSGYGQFGVMVEVGKQRTVRAHRWLWEQVHGTLDRRVVLDHFVCDTPACVNLKHLRPTTHRENVLRSDTSHAALNLAKTHCPKGHPYSGDNLIERGGSRTCRECARAHWRDYARRKRAALRG